MTAINIQLTNNFNEEPIEEENVWMDDVIPTINKLVSSNNVDELLLIGPTQFTGRIKDRIENVFPNLKVILGDEND